MGARGLMAPRKSSFKRITSNSRKRRNPDSGPSFTDSLIDQFKPIGVGIGSYAVSRLAGRIAFRLGRKKSESLGKHLGPWTSVGVALASAYAADKVEALQPFKTEIIVGATIAAVQGVLGTYVPQYAWILNDYHLDELIVPVETPQGQPQRRVTTKSSSSASSKQQAPAAADAGIDVDDFSDIPGFDSGSSFKTGIFS